jgi:hypothetical protein
MKMPRVSALIDMRGISIYARFSRAKQTGLMVDSCFHFLYNKSVKCVDAGSYPLFSAVSAACRETAGKGLFRRHHEIR